MCVTVEAKLDLAMVVIIIIDLNSSLVRDVQKFDLRPANFKGAICRFQALYCLQGVTTAVKTLTQHPSQGHNVLRAAN